MNRLSLVLQRMKLTNKILAGTLLSLFAATALALIWLRLNWSDILAQMIQ
ncbi:hypothetical protein [Reinekea sp.]|jgi:hypothetical protein|nr:hypothetical protein [Reinekea sp.]